MSPGRPPERDIEAAIDAELTEPTEAMAASYAALGREHRELLLAMIDSPPGPVAERDLADALRRHTSDGLPEGAGRSRRPAHRSLPEGHGMRVDWVHPSWRDLVIESLAEDAATRRHFLARCGVDGAAVALSGFGGAAGERERPLLREDADWDALGDGLYRLCHDIDEVEATQLLRVLDAAGDDREVLGLIELVLKRLRWAGQAIHVDALIAWARVAVKLEERPEPPAVAMTWLELEPHHAPETPQELERFADWLRLAELLQEHDPALLEKLEFPQRYTAVLAEFAHQRPSDEPVLERETRIETLDRLAELDPRYEAEGLAEMSLAVTSFEGPDLPPPRSEFPVERVLRDLG